MYLKCFHFLVFLFPLLEHAHATSPVNANPLVRLSYGSFRGKASGNIAEFLGMPFAAPPLGKRRFGLPEPPVPFEGVRDATSYGDSCLQQNISFPITPPPFLSAPPPFPTSEDCLTINVVSPANIPKGKYLPILFYIYGGGFATGSTAQNPGNSVVNRSIALGEPVIFISANYRVNAFGFLGGKEVKAAGLGNAGLHDQRFALQWVHDNIVHFGGDPNRVKIWGESAGAVSVATHFLVNDGQANGLFTGAVMESGSPIPFPDILRQQQWFDLLVGNTNCSNAADRLECLRGVPADHLLEAINLSPDFLHYQSLRLTWQPMIDGKFIVRDPLISLRSGKYAKIPFITGDVEDEGTLFSYGSLNVTTNKQFLDYMKSIHFQNAKDSDLQELALAYPDDITKGSPFNSGTAHSITPQFKRIAAVQGDFEFQAPRRHFLEIASKTQSTYAFRYARGAATPGFGSLHGLELPEFFGLGDRPDYIGVDAVVFFANKGNPNAPKNSISLLRKITWDKWSSSPTAPPLLTFWDPSPSINVTFDTYRKDAMKLLNRLSLNEIGNGL